MTFKLVHSFTASISMAGALASAMLFMVPVHAQDSSPMSLADRVARLEQQSQNQNQTRMDQVNQLQQMQSQMQQMQGQIEELQHQLQQLQDQGKAQYTDLDSRVGRLEKGGAPANSATTANGPAPASTTPGAPAAASTPVTPPPAPTAPAESAADKAAATPAYNAAFKSLKSGDYVASSRGFREFIQKYPNDSLTPNAFYWLGESYYATTNYQVAVEAFNHLLTQYPQSDKAPDALLKLGYSQLQMKQTDAGTATLKSVIAKYPSSNAAKLAQERLTRLSQQPVH
jgi:tol-pal system protein YbgF